MAGGQRSGAPTAPLTRNVARNPGGRPLAVSVNDWLVISGVAARVNGTGGGAAWSTGRSAKGAALATSTDGHWQPIKAAATSRGRRFIGAPGKRKMISPIGGNCQSDVSSRRASAATVPE